MSNAIQSTETKKVERPTVNLDPLLTKIFGDYEFNRYGWVGAIIIAMVCTGAVAVGVGAMSSPLQIGILAFATVIPLSLILAVAPMRSILYSSMISVAISIIMIIVNMI